MTQETKTSNLQAALQQAAAKLAEQLSDASALSIQTLYVEVDGDASVDMNDADFAKKFTNAKPVASTTIELDGDTTLVIPMRRENGVLVRDEGLLDLHLSSVETAMAYREKLLDAIINTIRQPRDR